MKYSINTISGLIPGGKRKIYDADEGFLKNLSAQTPGLYGCPVVQTRKVFETFLVLTINLIAKEHVIAGNLNNLIYSGNLIATTCPDFCGKQSLSYGVATTTRLLRQQGHLLKSNFLFCLAMTPQWSALQWQG